MSMTVYFAKLNLISEDIFKLYNKEKALKEISDALIQAVSCNPQWEKENIYYDDKNEPQVTTISYSLHILRTDDSFSNIEGWFYKKSKLYFNVLNERTNVLVRNSTENTEAIRFVLDTNHGFVGYNTASRFGYREFVEAFSQVINNGEEKCKSELRYNMSICNSGISLEDIKKELKSKGKLKELRIKMQPPNPSEDLLAELQKRADGVVQDFQNANITEMEMFYSSKGSSGINIEVDFINEKINDLQSLYSTLPIEESTKKGYISLNAVSVSGEKYSSGDSKPLKIIVEHIDEFFESCINGFRNLF